MQALLVSLFLSLASLANWFTGEGEFSFPHQIAMVGYENEEGCRGDGGEWQEDFCFFDVEDTVSVKLTNNPTLEYDVNVETWGTNGHSCTFEGKAKWATVAPVTLVATAEAEEWIPGENDEDGKFVPVTCELTLKYLDGDRLSVSNNGKCSYFCGMRAVLEIEEAKRK